MLSWAFFLRASKAASVTPGDLQQDARIGFLFPKCGASNTDAGRLDLRQLCGWPAYRPMLRPGAAESPTPFQRWPSIPLRDDLTAREVLWELDHFLLRTALKDRPKGPPTANPQPPTTANRHQLLAATNRQPPTTANRHQPPPTATNRQSPPTMVEHMSYTRSFCKTAIHSCPREESTCLWHILRCERAATMYHQSPVVAYFVWWGRWKPLATALESVLGYSDLAVVAELCLPYPGDVAAVGSARWFFCMRFGVPQCTNQPVHTLCSLQRLSWAVGISLSGWLLYAAMGWTHARLHIQGLIVIRIALLCPTCLTPRVAPLTPPVQLAGHQSA